MSRTRARPLRLFAIPFVCAAGCVDQRTIPEPPLSSAAASALFIVGRPNQARFQIASIDLGDQRGLRIPPFSADTKEDQVGLIYYDRPLAELQIPLESGRIPPLASGARGRPLPPPDRLLSLDLGKDPPTWVDVDLTRGSTVPLYLKLPLLPATSSTVTPNDPCALTHALGYNIFALDAEDSIVSVGVVDHDNAVAVSKSCSACAFRLIRLHRSAHYDELPLGALGAPIQVKSDHRGTVYGVTASIARGRTSTYAFAMDAAGRVTRTFPLRTAVRTRIAVTQDGRAFVYDDGHAEELGGQGERIALPPHSIHFLAYSEAVMAVATSTQVLTRVGPAFRREALGMRISFSDDVTLFGDAEILGVIDFDRAQNKGGAIIVRDADGAHWTTLDQLDNASFDEVRAALPIPGRRFFAVGGGGVMALRTGNKWCPIETGALRHLDDLDLTSDQKTLVVVAESAGPRNGAVLWFDLPPL